MDFITDLPLSSTYGSTTWDSILVVVDKLTKMAHYIPVQKTMSVTDFIKVFIRDVVKHHGMPEVLVTDRDKLFTSEKWTSFCFHMRCRCNVLTAFHPQTDGQTERQNQSLEAYLRIFVDEQQEDWAKLLPCMHHRLQQASSAQLVFDEGELCN
ncbi:gag polymerase env protein [Lasallia pustulata]|uniref:Gag polymerase env protein n=1 Tax=Lasallia pustulata TaxID=136370 RepID=A0A1W5CS98_9LECA|nr:gag polymerase env protein [Lasallia pustulata]